MAHPGEGSPGVTGRRSARKIALARDSFLASGGRGGATAVREPIKASWIRSLDLGISPDRPEPDVLQVPDPTSSLARAASLVLRQLRDELSNEPVSIILTDGQGLIQDRVCTDSQLGRWLDSARLSPGFTYAEAQVGTNGIGTTLEAGTATLVDGPEHFADQLARFSCAGAPIHHPITGSFVGVLDVTALTRHANSLLLPFARSAAQRIEERLLDLAGSRELALFQDYLTACQHTTGGVLALNGDVMMLNQQAQQRFDAGDQAALLRHSADAAGVPTPRTFVADLPSGLVARMDYRPSYSGSELIGGVFRIRLQPGLEGPAEPKANQPLPLLPGLGGRSAVLRRTATGLEASLRAREWVILEGEQGTGKLALVKAIHQLRDPAGHLCVMDAQDIPDEEVWLDTVTAEMSSGQGTLVVRRAHLLGTELVSALSQLLLEHGHRSSAGGTTWLVVTLDDTHRNPDVDALLLPHFSRSIEVPALRHHVEDLHEIVPVLLRRLTRGSDLTLSPEALRQLMRLPWPGNVDHVVRVLTLASLHRRSGVIGLDDLPPECRATSRRRLSHIEALERDAVVRALVAHSGRKEAAARELGVSRATIYRKIRDYGITLNA